MPPAHDLHGLYTNSVFTVFAFGRRNIFWASRKYSDHGHTSNHDYCKPQKPAMDNPADQHTLLQFSHASEGNFRRPRPALPLAANPRQVAAQLHYSQVDAG